MTDIEEHRLVAVGRNFRNVVHCRCGLIAQPDYERGGYVGYAHGLDHFVAFDRVPRAAMGGSCSALDVIGRACGLPRESHGSGTHWFDDVKPQPVQAVTDAPGAPWEPLTADVPFPPSPIRLVAAAGPVDERRVMLDARNAKDRLARLRRHHERRSRGERPTGPVPRP